MTRTERATSPSHLRLALCSPLRGTFLTPLYSGLLSSSAIADPGLVRASSRPNNTRDRHGKNRAYHSRNTPGSCDFQRPPHSFPYGILLSSTAAKLGLVGHRIDRTVYESGLTKTQRAPPTQDTWSFPRPALCHCRTGAC